MHAGINKQEIIFSSPWIQPSRKNGIGSIVRTTHNTNIVTRLGLFVVYAGVLVDKSLERFAFLCCLADVS